MRYTALVLAVTMAMAAPAIAQTFAFSDPALDAAVRAAVPLGGTYPDVIDITEVQGVGFTTLDASNQGITNISGLEYCTDLIDLNLAKNDISIVTPIASLTNLVSLDLSYNEYVSDVSDLASLTSLVFLDLGNGDPREPGWNAEAANTNMISDLTSLSGLTALQYLNVAGGTSLQDLLFLSGMIGLQELVLGNNLITDFSPLSGVETQLTLLVIVNCGFTDEDLPYINAMTNLTDLRIIDETGLTSISSLSGLNLQYADFSGSSIASLSVASNWTNLDYLDVSFTSLTDLTGLSAANNPLLATLLCNDTVIASLAPLSGMTALVTLDFALTLVSAIDELEGMTALDQLFMSGNNVSDLTALVNNASIGGEDYVNITGNPLTNEAACNQIPVIEGRFTGDGFIYDQICYYDLNLSISGQGNIDPSEGTYQYAEGDTVWVQALPTADTGEAFQGWTGDETSTSLQIAVLMDGDKTIQANFASPGDWTLTLMYSGSGIGSAAPLYTEGTYDFLDGQTPNLIANADTGYYFNGWTGDIETYNPQVEVLMDANKTLNADFTLSGYDLVLDMTGEGYTLPAAGTYYMATDTSPELSADPEAGWRFVQWTGDIGAEDPYASPIQVTMDQARYITAEFLKIVQGPNISVNAGAVGLPGSELYLDSDPEATVFKAGGGTNILRCEFFKLGLVQGDDIDALAYGDCGFSIDLGGGYPFSTQSEEDVFWHFSVDDAAKGVSASAVEYEYNTGSGAEPYEALGDIFVTEYYAIGTNAQAADQSELGLDLAPDETPPYQHTQDDLDALDLDAELIDHIGSYLQPGEIFFSLKAGSPSLTTYGVTEADILTPDGAGGLRVAQSGDGILACSGDASALGIAGNDLDALFVDASGMPFFSVATVIPGGIHADANPGDILLPDGVFLPAVAPIANGVADEVMPAGALGLQDLEWEDPVYTEDDNLNALDATLYQLAAVPAPEIGMDVVLVLDITPPIITLVGDSTVTLECGDSYVDDGATAYDIVDGDLTPYIAVGGDTVDTGTAGSYVITYDVSDFSANPAVQVTRTVNVEDTTPPAITLVGDNPMDVECGGAYSEPGWSATDTCDGDLTASVSTGGDTVNPDVPGVYTITYDVSDAATNPATQRTRTVNVVDTTPPIISLLGSSPMDIECGSGYTEPGVNATDACDGDLAGAVVIGGDTVNAAVPGTYIVTYDVSDAATNPATQQTRTVNVADTTSPLILLLGSSPMSVECGSAYTEPGVNATDVCDGDLTGSVSVGGDAVNTAVPGTYVVTYDVSDSSANPAVQQTRTVNVEDTTPPTITVLGDNPLDVECGSVYSEPGWSATDTCDGDLTASVSTGGDTVNPDVPGTYVVTYDVSDASFNAAGQQSRTVNVIDTTPPTITVLGDNPLDVECGSAYTDPGVEATDTCDGDLSGAVVIGGDSVNTTVPGTYVVTYDVSDAATNAADQQTRTVNVVDTLAPAITVLGDNPLDVECGSAYTDPGVEATDDCYGDLSGAVVIGGDSVNTTVPGTYTVTYDVSDADANPADQQSRTVNVIDTTPPTITVLGDNPLDVECGSAYTDPGVEATDTCYGDLSGAVVIGGDSVNTAVPGTYVVSYDVSDTAANAADQQTRTVNVVDTLAPAITVLGDNPLDVECGSAYTEPGVEATDTCDGDLSGAVVIGGDTVNATVPGTYVVTYDVSDAAANPADQQSRTVNVVDTLAPAITVLGDNPLDVECGSAYTDPGVEATDACYGDLSGAVVIGGDTVNATVPGTYVVTYDVSDAATNPADQQSRTVNVADTSTPVAVCQDVTVTLDDYGTGTLAGAQMDGGSTDNCGIASLSLSQDSFSCLDLGCEFRQPHGHRQLRLHGCLYGNRNGCG